MWQTYRRCLQKVKSLVDWGLASKIANLFQSNSNLVIEIDIASESLATLILYHASSFYHCYGYIMIKEEKHNSLQFQM